MDGLIVREALIKTFDCGVRVRVVTMDGTQHNVSTFKLLGCNMQPKPAKRRKGNDNIISRMKVAFKHPHSSAEYQVNGMLDPPHMGCFLYDVQKFGIFYPFPCLHLALIRTGLG